MGNGAVNTFIQSNLIPQGDLCSRWIFHAYAADGAGRYLQVVVEGQHPKGNCKKKIGTHKEDDILQILKDTKYQNS